MNRLPATMHRLVVLVVGVCAVVIGVAALTWRFDVAPVHRWIDRIDTSSAVRFADGQWWVAVLVGLAVVGLIVGVVLLISAYRPMKASQLRLPSSSATGDLQIAPGLIATAVANDLSRDPAILGAKGTAIDDRRRTIIRVTVRASSTTSFAAVIAACRRAEQTIDDAVRDADVQVQILLHIEHPERRGHELAA